VLETGDQIDIWVVDHPLGRGGMGSVYRCHNRNAPRILAAVKVLESHLRAHEEIEARFVREAEILFHLDHPNIVKVRNVRTDLDPPYLEMEFVEGRALEDLLQQGPLAYERALELMAQAAAAVHYLHRKGVCHRDIKPPNLLVRNDGRLKLVDFGLALEADTSRITQHGMAFGTVSYAPPEWSSPELDPISWDIYALGVVFWEMLTGEVAFPMSGQGSARQQAMQVMMQKQGHPPLDPGEAFPAGLRALIADMTCSDATERLVDSAEVRRRLHDLDGLGPPPPTDTFDPDDAPSVVMAAPTPGVPPTRRSQPTWSTSDPPAVASPRPASRRGLLAASLVSLSLVGAGALVLAGVLLAVWLSIGPDGRDVELVITGVGRDVPVDLQLAGRAPDGGTPLARTFGNLPPGVHTARWAVGEGCELEACTGPSCPAWCGTGSEELEVEPGGGPQVLRVTIDGPRARTTHLPVPGLAPDDPLVAELGSTVGQPTQGAILFQGVLPGEHPLRLTLGACPADGAVDCHSSGDCPSGCVDVRADVVVPWDPDPLDPLDVALPGPGQGGDGDDMRQDNASGSGDGRTEPPEPAPPSPPQPAAPAPAPSPTPAAAPAPAGGGTTVTVGRFASWLADHPEYQPGGPKAAGQGYLSGWQGATPPAGASAGAPATGLSWYVANAYCRSRGGLLPADAPVTSDHMFEWRVDDGGPAAVDNAAGALPTNGTEASIMAYAVTRCAR